MNLLLFWIGFITLISTFQDLNELYYLGFCNCMFCLTYLYNKLCPLPLSFKTTILLLILPSIIFWYIFFLYNDFLALLPIKYEVFMGLLLIYFYITLYFLKNYMTLTLTKTFILLNEICLSYQLDFLIPLIYPDCASFKKTVLEKCVNLWKVFLFIVCTHLLEIKVFELLCGSPESVCNAFHRVVFEKLGFDKICFNIKCFNSNCFTSCRFFLSFANNFFIT